MTQELLADLRSRINPAYQDVRGTESYERKQCADAIEALQKEVSTLDVLLEECKMDWSGDVTQIKAEHKHEIDALQAKLGDAIQSSAHWQHQFTEAQAENERLKAEKAGLEHVKNAFGLQMQTLQSQLDALSKGEPRFWYDEDMGELYSFSDNRPVDGLTPLYAAPKALAPLTDEQKNSAWDDHWSNPSIPSTACSAFYAGMRFAEKHHGIGGTP